jgi:cardiolipin synthase A/B
MTTVSSTTYRASKEVWEQMLVDISKADRTIDFESYIFAGDEIGRRFIEAFLERARNGVRVRILDMAGSFSFYQSEIPAELRRKGIEILFFNPISLWRIHDISANFFRDHRKVLVIDSTISYTGGVNVAEHMAEWRDTHVRLVGPVSEDMQVAFETMWEHTKKGVYLHHRPQRHRAVPKSFHRDWEVVTNAPRVGERHIYHALIDHIRQAKKYVYLTTPYFIPDIRFLRVLRLAQKRGVDVRIILPYKIDHQWLITSANNCYLSTLLRNGVTVYRYRGPIMHSKTAIIDDEWVFVGTFNLDSLSFVWNYEIAVRSKDATLIADVRQHFFDDVRSADLVDYETWKKRWFIFKCQEWMTWPLHKLL